jgi:hypothetical protein
VKETLQFNLGMKLLCPHPSMGKKSSVLEHLQQQRYICAL